MWFDRIRRVWRPDVFQGAGKRRNYFEGWYYKLVDRAEENVWAIIPGIAYGATADRSHAFIQFINGRTAETSYHSFPLSAFRAASDRLDLRLGDNRFTRDGLELNLPGIATGALEFSGTTPWPVRRLRPGAMGWYAFVPFMECYHGVVSLNHKLSGELVLGAKPVDFSGGLGYTEKDWGRSFPSAWIWLQTNHFATPSTCLMVSVARIPWIGQHFTGLLGCLWTDGRLHVFATYNGARVESLLTNEDEVTLVIADRRHRLEVKARRSKSGVLRSPVRGAMDGRTVESIDASVDVALGDRSGSQTLFQDHGRNAGLEVMGDVNSLLPGAGGS
jgi:tocopherol cyclase